MFLEDLNHVNDNDINKTPLQVPSSTFQRKVLAAVRIR